MKRLFRFLTVTSFALALVPFAACSSETEDEAVQVAEEWLQLVDQGKYEKSWHEAAQLFRSAVTVEQWRQVLDGVRKPLGELKSRKLMGAEYTTSMPGAPDGEYVVIQFKISFSEKETAVETVTPIKDDDGEWRVGGYFIK